jgi:NAD(P)-dependent dehydrogenase (short-subunit alcohol dehydrogenase family)
MGSETSDNSGGQLLTYQDILKAYDFKGTSIAITGGAGVLCGELACALAECGASVAILDKRPEGADRWKDRLEQTQNPFLVEYCDALDKESVGQAFEKVTAEFGKLDCLVNGAGGNSPKATTSPDQSFFDLPPEALRFVFDLNLVGTILPSQTAGKIMAERGEGKILNISSMNALRPLTRIPAYSAAKAGVSNFTQWLAVHMAQEYSPKIRVNAVAPGFFLTEQNRFLLMDSESGNLTARGKSIIDHTPAGRFGDPSDLVGAVLWLLSPASCFVTGVVLPVDGGFHAFSGV